ncbi:MAG: hypothetical protein ABI231_04235 [Candidatus Tumulicola sp.]
MRAYALVALALLLALAGCAGRRHAADAAASPNLTSPLHACETRELTLDGTDVVVGGNADATLASVHIVTAPNPAALSKALREIRRAFGAVRTDPLIVAHESKWGWTTWADRCGHPVAPRPSRVPPSP